MSDTKHNHGQHPHPKSKRQIHQDWRAWIVVGLMLAAMVIYVMTMDESIQPEGDGDVMPAATGE